MLARPAHWRGYHQGQPAGQRLARRFSLLDRSRYYWTVPAVQRAVERLAANLRRAAIPWTLASQYLPAQAERLREGAAAAEPLELVRAAVRAVLGRYARACRPA
jgi:D-tagatose-1,6-bisphosphate aldolase subunit GatZ/KbaZ